MFYSRCFIQAILILLVSITAAYAAKAHIVINHAQNDAIYKIDEKITWTISAKNISSDDLKNAAYTIKRGGLEILKKGQFDLNSERTLDIILDKPGSLLLSVHVPIKGKSRPYIKRSGALVDPDNITESLPKPNDFDAFWQKKIDEQNKIPMNPRLTAENTPRKDVDSWTITLDTIGGQKIQGRFSRPKKTGKYPALVIFQWAGVYGLNPHWSIHQAGEGFIVLNVMAHDIPINKDKSFYQDLSKGALRNYTHIGNNDRESSYFLRMCLASSRAIDYMSQRDDWDGIHILATGNSQGGYQAMVAAGLNKKVTGIMVSIPAGCDHTSFKAHRSIGWPYWMRGDTDNKDKLFTSRYFDAVNFSHNIRCPVLIGFGMGDITSPVEGILTAIHAMQGPVVTDITPNREHNTGPFKHYNSTIKLWRNSVRKSGLIPIKK